MADCYNKKEIQFIQQNYGVMPNKEIANRLGRTERSLEYVRRYRLGLVRPRKYPLRPPITIGERFTSLVVVSLDHIRKYGKYYLCQCDCGNRSVVLSTNLNRGLVKSCGCLLLSKTKKPPGYITIRRRFRQYKVGAAKREYDFCLTFEQFMEITALPCHYCGCQPPPYYSKINNRSSKENDKRMTVYMNGVDRYMNDIGYLIDNCVPCCTRCNLAKRDTDGPVFIEWVKKTAAHLSTISANVGSS